MIDPGYIPEDLTQYLLNYSGSQEEHNSGDNAQLYEVDSSDYGSIFIPPYASTPRQPHTLIQEDQESFQDSGMSEDESDSDLSLLQIKTKKNIPNSPNSGKLKSAKENSRPQRKTTKNLPCDSTKPDKNKEAVNPKSKKETSKKSEKQHKKLTTAQNGSRHSKNKGRETSLTSAEIPQDVTSISNKSRSKTNVKHIEKGTLDVSSEDALGSKTSSKTSTKKRPLPSEKAKGNSSPSISKKRKKNNKDEMSTSGALPNQDTENSLAMEILGDISSSEDESDISHQTITNTSTSQAILDNCQADADDILILPQSNDTKKSRNQTTSKNFQATVDGSGHNCTSTPSDSSGNHLENTFSDAKEPSTKTISISIDSSLSGETENHSSVSLRKKPTKSTSKAKKICTMTTEGAQDSSSFLFNTSEEMVTYLQKNKNKNVPLRVHAKSSNSSKPKGSGTDKAESKKNKTKDVGKKSSGAVRKDAQERNSLSAQRKKATPQRAETPKKSATKGDCDDKSSLSPKKNTSVKSSSPNTSNAIQAERHRMYREKKKKYFEDLEKEVESLRAENESLKDQNMSNSNDYVTDKGMGSDAKDLEYTKIKLQVEKKHQENTKETSLFIQDLKEEIQQLQREKKKLISVEDMESIVDDFKEEISQLKNQKKDLEINGKETDLLVCGLRQELEQLKKQNEELETERNNRSTDKIPVLEKEKDELNSKAKEMELFIEDLKKDIKDLAAEKEGCTRSNKEMKLLVNKLKEDIKTLKKNKDDLVSNEKEMKLNVKDVREKLDGLKKQNDDHESNARETDSVIKHLREELGELKTEKAVDENNAREMESTINRLKNEISALKKKKKEQETKFENMEREKVSYQSSAKDMDSVMNRLKDEISELEKEKETYQINVKEMECIINDLNDEISNSKTEKEVQEKKQEEMSSLINDLTNENIELKKKVKNKEDSFAKELEEKSGQLLNDNGESVSFLGEETPLSKNSDVGREVCSGSDKDYGEKLEQLHKEKEELKQNAGKMDIIVQDMKNELNELKNEKEKNQKSSEEMVTVVQSMKEDLDKLKIKEKDACDDVKGNQSGKEKGHCLTAEDMSYFVKDLKDEIGYLKGLIINQSELSALVKHVGTFHGFESSEEPSSGKRKLDHVSDNTGNESKRQKSGKGISTVKPAGVCLHVNNGKMSVEFCSTCSKSSSS